MSILKVLLVVVILGVILFLVYKKLIAPVSTVAVMNPLTGSPTVIPTTSTAIRIVGDANYCGWLNGTYPKLKTRQFSDIDGARDNPQALADWQKNNCDLINYTANQPLNNSLTS